MDKKYNAVYIPQPIYTKLVAQYVQTNPRA